MLLSKLLENNIKDINNLLEGKYGENYKNYNNLNKTIT